MLGRSFFGVRLIFCLLILGMGSLKLGESRAQPASHPHQCVEGIAVVVNKDVITWRDVDEGMEAATRLLTQQHIQLPPRDVLQRQVVQRLIMETLQRQEAARLHIQVSEDQVEQAITMVAARNHMSMAQLQEAVKKMGVTWPQYHKNLQEEIMMDALRQQVVGAGIVISNTEVKSFIQAQQRRQAQENAAQAATSGETPALTPRTQATTDAERVSLAQILVRVPENASPQQVAALRKKAQALLAQVKSGADFAGIAAASSDGPHALEGGLMGERPLENWPDLFIQAISHLAKGGVSNVFQSGNGFHILKVIDRRKGDANTPPTGATAPDQIAATAPGQATPVPSPLEKPVEIMQTRARHILIKPSSIMTDEQARQRLVQLRQRILKGGEDFAALAHRYSQDASAPQGGDLGWLSPGETVPAFEEAMNALKPGEISAPVHTQFGWHLIQVQKRRQEDIKDTLQSKEAYQALFERRLELGFQDYLEQLLSQAYVDNRIEKRQQNAHSEAP